MFCPNATFQELSVSWQLWKLGEISLTVSSACWHKKILVITAVAFIGIQAVPFADSALNNNHSDFPTSALLIINAVPREKKCVVFAGDRPSWVHKRAGWDLALVWTLILVSWWWAGLSSKYDLISNCLMAWMLFTMFLFPIPCKQSQSNMSTNNNTGTQEAEHKNRQKP